MRAVPLWLLAGCLPYNLGGDETDGFAPAPDLGDTAEEGPVLVESPPSVEDFVSTPVDAAPDALEATGGSAEVSVSHVLTQPCGTTWSGADVEADEDAWTLGVSYDASTSDTASGDCTWRLTYRVVSVSPGTWTLNAVDQSTTATVTR